MHNDDSLCRQSGGPVCTRGGNSRGLEKYQANKKFVAAGQRVALTAVVADGMGIEYFGDFVGQLNYKSAFDRGSGLPMG